MKGKRFSAQQNRDAPEFGERRKKQAPARLPRVLATGALMVTALAVAPSADAQALAAARTVYDDVVNLTNAERQKVGCPPLTPVAELGRAAQAHSEDMAAHDVMKHEGSDGSTMRTRVERSGYTGWRGLAENVAAGYQSAEAVVTAWMSSSSHRANIVNCQLKDVGVGYATNPNSAYGSFWTQDLGIR
ncbi:CAP domain-containing protein [Kibdelosporangium persicum]|uniref:Cysteine-rich secretory protein family protein n=1 Tax=Kibdelosporangium persicum TaxID=2698649 RepID=A0ABX2F732_9PSEU|nr:CAP domain-containing protein [Kibdelosporangium persicum]NRN67161.1 Cysteine-rich secretory protein family protein [Kibdelosporangium persicum]